VSKIIYLVARDRFKYRFKLSGLRPDFSSFSKNIQKLSFKLNFKDVDALTKITFDFSEPYDTEQGAYCIMSQFDFASEDIMFLTLPILALLYMQVQLR